MKRDEFLSNSIEICEQIEDKILERGLFSKYLGNTFDLSIEPQINKKGLSLQINITTSKKDLDHQSKVDITNHIFNKFIELAKYKMGEKENNYLTKKWYETILMLDGKIVFAID